MISSYLILHSLMHRFFRSATVCQSPSPHSTRGSAQVYPASVCDARKGTYMRQFSYLPGVQRVIEIIITCHHKKKCRFYKSQNATRTTGTKTINANRNSDLMATFQSSAHCRSPSRVDRRTQKRRQRYWDHRD